MSKEITRKYFDYNALPDKHSRAVLRQQATAIKAAIKRTQNDIIEIGRRLLDAKEEVDHGHFMDWCAAEFNMEYRTAKRFMEVADAFGKIDNLSTLTFQNSALYALSAPSVPDVAREEAIAIAETGETVTHARARAIVAAHKESTPTAPDDDADRVFEDDDEDLNPSNSTGLESETEPEAEYSGEVDGYGRPIAQSTPVAASDGDDEPTLAERARNAEVIHDTLSDKPKEEELSDDDWLETLPIWRVLKNKGHRGIILKEDLLGMRALWKAKETFEHHARRAFNLKASRNTPAQMRVVQLAMLPHPRDWQVCAPCRGNGCARCDHSGYDTSGAGISPLRAERGEVAL